MLLSAFFRAGTLMLFVLHCYCTHRSPLTPQGLPIRLRIRGDISMEENPGSHPARSLRERPSRGNRHSTHLTHAASAWSVGPSRQGDIGIVVFSSSIEEGRRQLFWYGLAKRCCQSPR